MFLSNIIRITMSIMPMALSPLTGIVIPNISLCDESKTAISNGNKAARPIRSNIALKGTRSDIINPLLLYAFGINLIIRLSTVFIFLYFFI